LSVTFQLFELAFVYFEVVEGSLLFCVFITIVLTHFFFFKNDNFP